MDGVDTIIDYEVKAWTGPFMSKLDESFIPRWREEPISIFRVPRTLQIQDPEAYAPTVVSIGPYHWSKRNRENLIEMEKRKHRITRRLFFLNSNPEAMAAECPQEVNALEKRARSCYADEEIDMESQEFTEMMVLDGCFIIGVLLFLKGQNFCWGEKSGEEREVVVMQEVPLIVEDLIKLENQIPFFILETLYRLLVPQNPPLIGFKYSISYLAVNLLRKLDPAGSCRCIDTGNLKAHHHLLHLFYQILLYDDPEAPKVYSRDADDPEAPMVSSSEDDSKAAEVHSSNDYLDIVKIKSSYAPDDGPTVQFSLNTEAPRERVSNWMRSAVELQEAGIKFKGKKDCNFLHVSFRDGVLEIPTLRIFERTIPMLRNLIAFEQCYPETSKHVTYFADLMDSLIDTLRDVKVLQDAGILKIGLNNQEEVAHLFNRLCKHVFYNNSRSYLGNVYRDVNRFCDSKCHRWRALLVREKFSNPWAIISLVVAFIFLVLNLLQTFYSVVGYYHPPSP